MCKTAMLVRKKTVINSVSICTAEARTVINNVVDPWHFGMDPDPDPHFWLMNPDPIPFISDMHIIFGLKNLIFC